MQQKDLKPGSQILKPMLCWTAGQTVNFSLKLALTYINLWATTEDEKVTG